MPSSDCTVLVISDADVATRSLQNLLEQADKGLGQVLAVRYDRAIAKLCQANSLQLILLDTDLLDRQDLDGLVEQLKARLGDRCPPIIAIGPNDAELAAQAFRTGATDYWIREQITPARLRQALEALPWTGQLQRQSADLDAFRVTLADALRSLADPIEIQVTASRILGEWLNANRALYFECRNGIYCVERDYASGVDTIAGCYPVTAFGLAVFAEFCAGRSVVVADVSADPRLSPAERATYASVQVVAHMGIPLVKAGHFVAGLAVHSSTPRTWTQAEVKLAEETAERTWDAVERARAEAALRQSEEKYRTLFQNIAQGFCLLDMIFDDRGQPIDFRYLETNPAFIKHAGQPMAGKRIRELLPNFEQIWIDTYGQVALTGEPVRLEHIVEGLGDQWFETYVFRYGGEGSRIVAVLFTNITARKQAELALREREEQFRLLSEVSPVGIFRNDIHGQCTYANAKTLEITGLSLEENLGDGWGKYLHPGDRDWMYAAWLEFVEQTRLGQPATYCVEHRYLYQDGSIRWGLGQAVPEYNAQGELVGFIGTVTDITDRKQAQENITRELNRRKAMLEASSDGIVVLNRQGYVVEANESYARMLGRTVEETLTLHVSDWDAQWTPAELDHIVGSRQFVGSTFETVHRRQDGSTYDVEITVSAVDTDDEFLQLCICRDISERKRREANTVFLAEVTVDLSRLTAADEIMQIIGAKLGAYLQLSACAFVVLDHAAQEATITYDWHRSGGITLAGVYRLSDFLTPDFLRDTRDGKPFVVCNTETDPRTNAASYASLSIQAFCTVSFHQDGQLRSLLAIYDANPRQWRTDEIELVGELANQIFPRLERAGAEAALQRYNEALEVRVAERTAELSQSLSALQQSEERLHHLAHHDPLTGLPNRLWLNVHLEQSIQQATRQQTKLALLFVDLDRFKHINDSLGHRAGDSLLQQLGDRLHQALRANDCVARISGDEFVVVLEDIKDVPHIGTAISRLMTVFEAPFHLEEQTVHMTASIGISLFPDDSSEAAALLRYADTAMYEAKEEGRNTYRFYAEEMTATAFEHVLFGNALRNALQQQQLHLVYQPQINLQSQRWVGLEVLLRWQHPELGEISPAQFIPIAEQSGLIHEIGTWVLQSACCQAKTWLDQGLDFGRVAVNVAASQLNHENFVQIVEEVLRKSGLPPQHLELEVTERLVMQRTEAKIQQLKQLRQMGVQIAIDDFGTGYSSLSYLKLLPIDKLKIDKSFVCDIPHDANDMAIAAAVIALGHALGMTIIAEGVEEEAQVAFLKLKGCHEAQGYLYSRPLRPEMVPAAWNRCQSNTRLRIG
jgi:diguanylate cyclase (GGDEF)-like protein/PAS domain S-box-containing protein